MEYKCEYCGEPCKEGQALCLTCWITYKEGFLGICEECKEWFSKEPHHDDLCKECYTDLFILKRPSRKLKNQQIQSIPQDEIGERYKTIDGHLVRSKAEMIIDDFLYNHDVKHAYEIRLPTTEEENRYCDFYLPVYDVYIEYWGLATEDYNKRRKEKVEIYGKNELKRIDIEESDMKQPNESLVKIFSKFFKVK